jgi:ribonucleoside-diphosphate reductase alpha chain
MELPEYVTKDDLETRLSENALHIFNSKYVNRNDKGEIIETPKERFYIVSKAMAEVELKYEKNQEYVDNLTETFYKMISGLEFLPGGRVITNTGKGTALFNCYVLPVEDTIEDVFEHVKLAAIIHKQGGGTGYNFSYLRPKGSYVAKSQGMASGPLSFMEQFDVQTKIINSGNRRGANMGILNVDHPDILDFIYAKPVENKFKNFNISIGITDEFMQKVEENGYYSLKVRETKEGAHIIRDMTRTDLENYSVNIEKHKAGADVGQKAPPHSLYIKDDKVYNRRTDEEIGRVKNEVIEINAPKLLDLIATMAHATADPGMIFLDSINKNNPIPGIPLEATNPCGEQPLHPYDACNLGSLNLNKFVHEKDEKKSINYERMGEVIEHVVRFMDNVNDASIGPIPKIEESTKSNRRIGLGVMGFSDMLLELGIRYDSERGIQTAEEVMKFVTDKALEISRKLAEEKGAFPNLKNSIYNKEGLEDKVRNLHRTTIAPTGSISMLADVNSGIEPPYAIAYVKEMRGGERAYYSNALFEKIAKERGFYSKELEEKIVDNGGSVRDLKEVPQDVQDLFGTALSISPEWHVRMQAAFQKHTENAVSKTINLPENATIEDVRKAYILAWETGCKGTTVYRDKCKKQQVLVVGKQPEKGLERGEILILPEYLPDSDYLNQRTPWGKLHMHIDCYKDKPVQVFTQLGKGGEVVNADLEGISRLASLSLRLGGTLDMVIRQLEGVASQKMMATKEGTISSLSDGVAIALQKYLLLRQEYEKERDGDKNIDVDPAVIAKKIKENKISKNELDFAEKCPECDDGKLIPREGCWVCSAKCGYSRC